jgi:hypothetical protein
MSLPVASTAGAVIWSSVPREKRPADPERLLEREVTLPREAMESRFEDPTVDARERAGISCSSTCWIPSISSTQAVDVEAPGFAILPEPFMSSSWVARRARFTSWTMYEGTAGFSGEK